MKYTKEEFIEKYNSLRAKQEFKRELKKQHEMDKEFMAYVKHRAILRNHNPFKRRVDGWDKR